MFVVIVSISFFCAVGCNQFGYYQGAYDPYGSPYGGYPPFQGHQSFPSAASHSQFGNLLPQYGHHRPVYPNFPGPIVTPNPKINTVRTNPHPGIGGRGHHGRTPQGCPSTPAVPPRIDWGECQMLEPKEEEKAPKVEKQKECMKDLELNENSTFTSLSPGLQERIRECVLRKDELLNPAGKYAYDKALENLKGKALPEEIQKKADEAHVECKIQAERKFLNQNRVLAEVENYQDCMDFHLALLCKIKVIQEEDLSQGNKKVPHFHGIQLSDGSNGHNDFHPEDGQPGEAMVKAAERVKILREFRK